jgi:hypothetical protein
MPVSVLFFPEGKQERDYARRDQYCCDSESCRRDFSARMKALFKSGSHANEKKQQSGVEENYADRPASVG